MKTAFSVILSCALQFCFAQVDFTLIHNANEITSLKKEISEDPWEIYCENATIIYRSLGEEFGLTCSKEGDDVGMMVFGKPESDTLLAQANSQFIRQVMNTEFEGSVDLMKLSVYSNKDKALLYLELPKIADGLSEKIAFLYLRP